MVIEQTRTCLLCGSIKPIEQFYKHKPSRGGRKTKCASCCRDYSNKYRAENLEHYRAYDRARGYRGDELQTVARNAVRKLERQPCQVCGAQKSEAHHPDYSKPLEVIWFCHKHHSEAHRKYQDAERAIH